MTGERFNDKMVKIVGDIIQNKLPVPLPQESKEGKIAWNIAGESLKYVSNGKLQLAIRHMIHSLRSGVPEPVNSHLKPLLLKLIDQQIKQNINFNKNFKLLYH